MYSHYNLNDFSVNISYMVGVLLADFPSPCLFGNVIISSSLLLNFEVLIDRPSFQHCKYVIPLPSDLPGSWWQINCWLYFGAFRSDKTLPFCCFQDSLFFCPFCSLPLLFLSCGCCYIWMFACVPQVTEAFCSFSLFLLSVLRLYHLIRSIFKIGRFSYMFRSAIETSREFTIIVL